MRRLESGISIDNEAFSDVARYENETISRTTIINSNVRSPIFWSCHLDHLVFDTCDLTNARFFAGSTIDHCTFSHSDLRSVSIGKNETFSSRSPFTSLLVCIIPNMR